VNPTNEIKPINPSNPSFEFVPRGIEGHTYFIKKMVGAVPFALWSNWEK
jgi:hypothetical protein